MHHSHFFQLPLRSQINIVAGCSAVGSAQKVYYLIFYFSKTNHAKITQKVFSEFLLNNSKP